MLRTNKGASVKHATDVDTPKDSCVEIKINGEWTYVGIARFYRSSAMTAFLSKYVEDFDPQAVSAVTRLQAMNCGVTRVALVPTDDFRKHFRQPIMEAEEHAGLCRIGELACDELQSLRTRFSDGVLRSRACSELRDRRE